MNHHLSVLGLAPDASDDVIRCRYLELVRMHPPERDPKRFAEVRAAYDALRDPVNRLKCQLFNLKSGLDIDDVISQTLTPRERKRFPTETLLSLGR